MNRTLLPQASSLVLPSPSTSSWLKRQEFALPVEPSIPATAHSCFAPVHYEAGYAYPLIVWLHGHRSNEEELRQIMPLISVRNHIAIAPRGTERAEGAREAFGWGDSADDIAEAGERVHDCIAIAQERFNVHPDRIFVAGHSAGGTMAHRLGMEFPERFAGAISLGGRVPRGMRLLKNINRARRLPLLLSVSPTIESDVEGHVENYSTQQVISDLRFLHSAGLTLSLRLYPEGDELTTVMFSDLNNWLFARICG